eukprot:2154653-Prymnesium_polylepis.1
MASSFAPVCVKCADGREIVFSAPAASLCRALEVLEGLGAGGSFLLPEVFLSATCLNAAALCEAVAAGGDIGNELASHEPEQLFELASLIDFIDAPTLLRPLCGLLASLIDELAVGPG